MEVVLSIAQYIVTKPINECKVLTNSNKDYNDVVDNIYKRREEKLQLQLEIAEQDNGRERMKVIAELLKEQTCELEIYL